MNRSDLPTLADLRIAEAHALVQCLTPLPDGAYYLAGYAVECALKACIAKFNQLYDWPEKQFVAASHTHRLGELLKLSQLEALFIAECQTNIPLGSSWSLVPEWRETSRYERHSLVKAQLMIGAYNDPSSGVVPWIKVHW